MDIVRVTCDNCDDSSKFKVVKISNNTQIWICCHVTIDVLHMEDGTVSRNILEKLRDVEY